MASLLRRSGSRVDHCCPGSKTPPVGRFSASYGWRRVGIRAHICKPGIPAALKKPASGQSRSRACLAITAQSDSNKVGVLFVCLGNICRSPSAEAVFKDNVKRAQLEDKFDIDSCGLGGGSESWYLERGWSYHEGHRADERMRETAALRGLELTSRSRPLKPEDLSHFDYIVAMDFANKAEMQIAIAHWADSKPIPANYRDKVSLMCRFLPEGSKFQGTMEIPDPYYDDDAKRRGFHHVLDLLNDACHGLLETIIKERNLATA